MKGKTFETGDIISVKLDEPFFKSKDNYEVERANSTTVWLKDVKGSYNSYAFRLVRDMSEIKDNEQFIIALREHNRLLEI